MIAILEMIKAASNDALKSESMVSQLWSDGEITMTKGGELLGKRTLHCMGNGILDLNSVNERSIADAMPHNSDNGYSYIYCQSGDARAIRDLILELG